MRAGMVPVSPPEEQGIPDPDRGEMEDLLHFAITHSNLTLLREMATTGTKLDPSEITQVLDAMHEADRLFYECVNRTLILRNWESVEETIAAINYMLDYGNHLVDKADLIHKKGALTPLIDLILSPSPDMAVYLKLLELTVDISQNRETAQLLLLQARPSLVGDVVDLAVGSTDDEQSAALVSVVNSIIGGNTDIQAGIDDSVLNTLVGMWDRADPKSTVFVRLITTFRILAAETASLSRGWVRLVDMPRILSEVGSLNLFVGDRVLAVMTKLSPQIDEIARGAIAEARLRLHAQCIQERGNGDEICSTWKSSNHSDEL